MKLRLVGGVTCENVSPVLGGVSAPLGLPIALCGQCRAKGHPQGRRTGHRRCRPLPSLTVACVSD